MRLIHRQTLDTLLDFWPQILMCLAVLVLGYYIGKAVVEEQREWEAFAASHNCVVVEKRQAVTSSGYGMRPNGEMGLITTTTPAQTAYKCDDGVTYWR